jgi:hypothetical protein
MLAEYGGGLEPETVPFLVKEGVIKPKGKKAEEKPAEGEPDTAAAEGEEKPAEAEEKTEEEPEPDAVAAVTAERDELAAKVADLEAKLAERDVETEQKYETIWASSQWAIDEAETLLARVAEMEGWDQDKLDLYQLRAEQRLKKAIEAAPEVGAAKKAREAEKAAKEEAAKAAETKAKEERKNVVKANLAIAMKEVPGVPAAVFIQKFFDPRTGVFDTKAAKKEALKAKPPAKPVAAKKPVAKSKREPPPGMDPDALAWMEQQGVLDEWLGEE